MGRHHVVEAFAVERDKRVDIDQPLDPVRKTVGNSSHLAVKWSCIGIRIDVSCVAPSFLRRR
jgi:hypothetical protein